MPNPPEIPLNLRHHVVTILTQMMVISESTGTSAVVTTTAKDADTTTVGPRLGTRWCKCHHTMYDHWADRFASETSTGRLRSLVLLAQRDLGLSQHRPPDNIHYDQNGQHETSQERDVRMLDWYAGIHPIEASMFESAGGQYCSAKAIRKLRLTNDMDPDTGHEIVPLNTAIQECVKLRNEGLPQRKIADQLGISQATVSRRLNAAIDTQRRMAA